MKEIGWKSKQENERSISDYDVGLTILKGKRKGKRILGGRILNYSTVLRNIQTGHWKYSSQIHLLEESTSLLP